jgi:hypothetical protein
MERIKTYIQNGRHLIGISEDRCRYRGSLLTDAIRIGCETTQFCTGNRRVCEALKETRELEESRRMQHEIKDDRAVFRERIVQ